MELNDSISSLKGVGPKKTEAFLCLGIRTIEDLVFTFPRIYEDRRNVVSIDRLQENVPAVFTGEVVAVSHGGIRKNRGRVLRLFINDSTGSVEVVFFNGAYLSKSTRKGDVFTFFGTPVMNNGRLQLIHPEFEKNCCAETGILPIYPLTKGISQREMRRLQKAVGSLYTKAEDVLSQEIISRNNLCSIEYALSNIHFPENKQKLLESKYRIIFEEFLILQTGIYYLKGANSSGEGIAFERDNTEQEYMKDLPYHLTAAQLRCVGEIVDDLCSTKQMNRLIQGDVGSGKTALAEIAMFKAVKCGYQAVMMAPTEILARQHYEGIRDRFAYYGITVDFLAGSMKQSEKAASLKRLHAGETDVLIGTHAVIQPDVKFRNLGIVITDEQHRFGVNQRTLLKKKGKLPNVMVMTATPIPRTLAVVFYGEMDVSVLDEMPPGRSPVVTKTITGDESRRRCFDFVKRQIEQGRQAYVVTPLIDQSESMDARSAQEVFRELSNSFERCSLLHGGMKQMEKDNIMEEFASGKIDVLVSTVVIEVGINVPNATVMVIENSERFGLAQLHQLRGRVGRGKWQSYCFLIMGNESEIAHKRGKIMEESTDGFFIAEEDLKIRGPGEIFGTRQHGLPDLKLADMAKHIDVYNAAGKEAERILADDPELAGEENRKLRKKITELFGDDMSLNL